MEISISFPIFISLLVFSFLQTATHATMKSYIVYMGESADGPSLAGLRVQKLTSSHLDVLGSCLHGNQKAEDLMIYSYTTCMNGFAALLDESQVQTLRDRADVISVLENKERKLHTTRSWEFLGFENNRVSSADSLQKKANFGAGVIIANIDSGVWPESKSFSDEGMGPVPSRWKGTCQPGGGVTCNRKLIGARYFNKGFAAASGHVPAEWNTARDADGHGSHTLSTAAGNFVPGVNVFGVGNGTAKGGSPKAHVAAYKVCWPSNAGGCFDADILAAFDAAINDGVDVISVSLGPEVADEFYTNGLSIGSFNAIKRGIPVIASGGNSGPDSGSVANVAPWLFTISASSLDREFTSTVTLGSNESFKGASITGTSLPTGKSYPLIHGEGAKRAKAKTVHAQYCGEGTLDAKKVSGKIIVCLGGPGSTVDQANYAKLAGAVGMISALDGEYGNKLFSYADVLPTVHISWADGEAVIAYIKSTKGPTASFSPTRTDLRVTPSPTMAVFSSRGPNTIEPAVLKPDVTAPGIDIIAAYTEAIGPSGEPFDHRRTPYITMSGTSMSCPHVSGIVGLLKVIHPDWSPAAIKSAIMTTATTAGNNKNELLDWNDQPATPFSYGAGHIQPNLAADPGLVYDTTVNDYLNFLCAHGYNNTLLKAFSNGAYKCPKTASFDNFNYPSITVPDLKGPVTVTRRVKNVGPRGTYAVTIRAPPKVSVTVDPKTLTFMNTGEEKIFRVKFMPVTTGVPKDYAFGELRWSDGKHQVRSPLVVKHA